MELAHALPFDHTMAAQQTTFSSKKVVIAGGALAGLTCAYELRKLGSQVVVLEGHGHPGGRVYTLEGLAPGLTSETEQLKSRILMN
jgi:monoamine oxidase